MSNITINSNYLNNSKNKSYQNSDDKQSEEIIIHNNQMDIFDFLQPKQTTIYDFMKASK